MVKIWRFWLFNVKLIVNIILLSLFGGYCDFGFLGL